MSTHMDSAWSFPESVKRQVQSRLQFFYVAESFWNMIKTLIKLRG